MIPTEVVSIPDGWFYYTLSSLLAMALIAIIWKYVAKTENCLGKLETAVNKLITISEVHEVRIKNLEGKKIGGKES
jgi:hypothetical protein